MLCGQCKREAHFGPRKVQDAVAALTLEGCRGAQIFLARIASPAARIEIAKHANWTLEDKDDLSRKVRNRLSVDQAIRVVDRYFPGWREPFLGIPNPSVWRSWQDFFISKSGRLLEACALIQPIRIKDESFRQALEQLTNRSFNEVLPIIERYCNSGLLLKRGNSIRIVPDLLGDAVLRRASHNQFLGESTGFVENTLVTLSDGPLENAFVNACRIDWMLAHGDTSGVSTTDSLWSALQKRLEEAGIQGRTEILSLIARVTVYAPDKALRLARFAIQVPTNVLEPTDEPFGRLFHPTHERDIVPQVVKILRSTLYSYPIEIKTALVGDRRLYAIFGITEQEAQADGLKWSRSKNCGVADSEEKANAVKANRESNAAPSCFSP